MTNPLQVLIVEDLEDDALLLLRELRCGGYEPIWERVETPKSMSAALERQQWDIILSDYSLPKFSGPAALKLLKEKGLDIPFIVISGTIGEDVAVQAMIAGANDYLMKGKLKRLVPAVERELREAEIRRERKRAEESLRKVNRSLKMLSECNKTLVLALEEFDLLQTVCKNIIEIGGYLLAWVGYAEDNEEKTVRPVAKAGCGQGYLDTAQITWSDTEFGQGPTGKAIRTGQVCICDDILTDPTFAPWRDKAHQWGLASSVSLPLKMYNRTFGVLNISASEPAAFDKEEIKLLTELAADLAYGIMSLRTGVERSKAERELYHSLEKLRKTIRGIIQAVAITVEMRDPYTAGHQRRVASLSLAIAKEMNLPEDKIEAIHMAAIVHDLGKISIPAEILSKPGRLADVELSLIRTHSQVGYNILSTIEFPWPIAQIVLQHHERLDGSGYPQGLTGVSLLLEAKILSVADVVEAMASHRPYRPSLGIDKALEEITQKAGVLYDPDIVNACLKVFREKDFQFERNKGNQNF